MHQERLVSSNNCSDVKILYMKGCVYLKYLDVYCDSDNKSNDDDDKLSLPMCPSWVEKYILDTVEVKLVMIRIMMTTHVLLQSCVQVHG